MDSDSLKVGLSKEEKTQERKKLYERIFVMAEEEGYKVAWVDKGLLIYDEEKNLNIVVTATVKNDNYDRDSDIQKELDAEEARNGRAERAQNNREVKKDKKDEVYAIALEQAAKAAARVGANVEEAVENLKRQIKGNEVGLESEIDLESEIKKIKEDLAQEDSDFLEVGIPAPLNL